MLSRCTLSPRLWSPISPYFRVLAVSALLILTVMFGSVSLVRVEPAHALVQGVPLSSGFPRLSHWSPDVDNQPLEDIARFDYVVLYDGQAKAISELRRLNPDIVLLTYASAVEIGVNHQLLKQVPNAWMLQQQGSILTSSVSEVATRIPVAHPARFRAGQLVAIDDELVKVVGVGAASIEVSRGFRSDRSPAAKHAKGARLAAVVQRRPSSIEMNITRYCPTVETSFGRERWSQFAARHLVSLCGSADWNGIVADRTENHESFLVRDDGNLVESIDMRSANLAVTDGYREFDAAWATGVKDFLTFARNGLGPHRILVGNNAAPHYGLVNGSSIENFPRLGSAVDGVYKWDTQWWSTRRAFYDNWSSLGQQPNFSTVITYDYEPEPTATDPLRPLKTSLTSTDYRKMRLGLTTALMSDGFFTYQLRVWGPRIGTYWFDEYDNVGAGKGYLGAPISAQRLALPSLTTADKLGGIGSFSTATARDRWKLNVAGGYTATKTFPSRTVKVEVSRSGVRVDGATLYSGYFSVKSGSLYTVKFRARADRDTTVRVRLATRNSPWNDWVTFSGVPLGTGWRSYEYSGYARGSDADARVVFDVSGGKKTIWLDSVTVQGGSRLNVMRRDFEGGVAIVNASESAVTIPLGTNFRRLAGRQAPAINSGALTVNNQVYIPKQDGIILLRATTAPRVKTYLTGSAAPSLPATYGAPVRIAGNLRNTTSTGPIVSKATVYLQTSYDGKSGWTTRATGVTSSTGYVSFNARPNRTTYYRLRFPGRSGCYFSAVSEASRVIPKPYVGPSAAPLAAMAGRSFAVTGTVNPRHTAGSKPIRIYRYRYESGKWKSYGYVLAAARDLPDRLDASLYTCRTSLSKKGKWRLRAYHPRDSLHQATWAQGYSYITIK